MCWRCPLRKRRSFLWATDKIASIGRCRAPCLSEWRADRRREHGQYSIRRKVEINRWHMNTRRRVAARVLVLHAADARWKVFRLEECCSIGASRAPLAKLRSRHAATSHTTTDCATLQLGRATSALRNGRGCTCQMNASKRDCITAWNSCVSIVTINTTL